MGAGVRRRSTRSAGPSSTRARCSACWARFRASTSSACVAPAAGLIVFIGCFLVLGDKRQALHDMGAATAVFRKADLGA